MQGLLGAVKDCSSSQRSLQPAAGALKQRTIAQCVPLCATAIGADEALRPTASVKRLFTFVFSFETLHELEEGESSAELDSGALAYDVLHVDAMKNGWEWDIM